MKLKILIAVLAAAMTAGCGSRQDTTTAQRPSTTPMPSPQRPGSGPMGGYYGPMMGPMMRGPQAPATELRFKSNGQRIYYTATSTSGPPITATGGPHWFQMHGGSCVDCHGPDGRGGYTVPMTDVVAPNVTYSALTSKEHEMHGEEHPPYTEALIKRAITKGLEPAGKPLSYAMPRWSMSSGELNDLIAYLKTLGK